MYSITSVRRALSEDIDARMRRYAFSMTVRTACILAAIVVPSPWQWVCLAGAVVIPLIAVLVANAGRELPADPDDSFDPWGLPAGPTPGAFDAPGYPTNGARAAPFTPTTPRGADGYAASRWRNDPTADYLR